MPVTPSEQDRFDKTLSRAFLESESAQKGKTFKVQKKSTVFL